MVEDGWITQAERDAAVFPETIDPDTLNSASMTGTNGYLMAQVKQELIASGQFDEDKISQGGLRISLHDRQGAPGAGRRGRLRA